MTWFICEACEGEGRSSAHIGSFTMSEFEETFDDPESRADYFAGRYDKVCKACNGSGKLKRDEAGNRW